MEAWQIPKSNRAKKENIFQLKKEQIDDEIIDLGIE